MDILYSGLNSIASFISELAIDGKTWGIGFIIAFALCQIFSGAIRRVFRGILSVVAIVGILISIGITPSDFSQNVISPISNIPVEISKTFDNVTNFFKGTKAESEKPTKEPQTSEVDGVSNVHFIDVGQADCILIENGEDTILIDTGNYADVETVTAYLDGLGITQIDYFIASHPHEDHIGSAATILRLYDVDMIINPDADNDTVCYTEMMREIKKSDIPTEIPQIGDTYESGDGSFQILGPVSKDNKNLNNNSIVLRYVYGDTSFLFTGDAEREEELEIIDQEFILSSDVIKVGHHGSNTSSSYPWLREVMPKYAVISVGKDNSYGHPHDDALSKYADVGAQIYRTDESGTIVFSSNGKGLEVFCEK